MSSALRNVIAICSALEVGVLAGILVGTGMTAYAAKALPELSWTRQFQVEDVVFSKAMPPFMLSTLLLLVVSCVMSRSWSQGLFGTSVVLMLLVLATTIVFEVPLNRQIQGWTAGDAPVHWTVIRDRWLTIHILRTALSMGASTCAIWALVCL